MKSFKNYLFIFISLSCICGMCSKDDDNNSDNNEDNYTEPSFNPNATWVYMQSGSLPSFYGTENKRPVLRKWVATKIIAAVSGELDASHNYLSFSFENTDKDTRFLTNKLNPNGKESLSILLKNFSDSPPSTGTYTMDIDDKNGYCWYYVYNSAGTLVDSVRTQGITSSSFTINRWDSVSSSSELSVYKMSGTADIQIMYWKSGTSSTSDIQNLQCTFNNVAVTFVH